MVHVSVPASGDYISDFYNMFRNILYIYLYTFDSKEYDIFYMDVSQHLKQRDVTPTSQIMRCSTTKAFPQAKRLGYQLAS